MRITQDGGVGLCTEENRSSARERPKFGEYVNESVQQLSVCIDGGDHSAVVSSLKRIQPRPVRGQLPGFEQRNWYAESLGIQNETGEANWRTRPCVNQASAYQTGSPVSVDTIQLIVMKLARRKAPVSG